MDEEVSTQDAIAVALDVLRMAQDDAPEELLRLLRRLDGEPDNSGNAILCGVCGARTPYYRLATGFVPSTPHMRACRLAHWLRVFGGDEERQRQVDAAHDAASLRFQDDGLRERIVMNGPFGRVNIVSADIGEDRLTAYSENRVGAEMFNMSGVAAEDQVFEVARMLADMGARPTTIIANPRTYAATLRAEQHLAAIQKAAAK